MIPNNNKTSILIKSQLPQFISDSDEYSKFVAFIEAYYEWMEENENVLDHAKNLLNYKDIDHTTSEFLKYFVKDFLPYFPEDALIDKARAVKFAKQLYQSKGTPASFQFLFRVLYNSDFDYFYTKDFVLRASDGIWYVPKSLKLSSNDPRFLNIKNLRIFGENTKSLAVIENSILTGNKIEVFISDIQRIFESGEFVRVVDNFNQDVLFDGQPLRAKIVGQISQLNIVPSARGLFYKPGDPVIVYGGLNSPDGVGATAQVGTTTRGSIQSINVINGGYGYQLSPNTEINISANGGATAVVSSVDPRENSSANVAFVPINTLVVSTPTAIGGTYNFFTNNPTANANTKLSDAFTFSSFLTYPISALSLRSGGGGYDVVPTVEAISQYDTDLQTKANLKSLGILAPIQIIDGGVGYVANDVIVFSGGDGVGASANVTAVSNTGSITQIKYTSIGSYPFGGMGYNISTLPLVSVLSSNVAASNANIFIPGILGDGATFSVVTDRTGSISTILITNAGEDYVETPNVSLRVHDILVKNITIAQIPKKDDIVYQGENINVASYRAVVDSIQNIIPDQDPLQTLYSLRAYNYTATPDPNLDLKIDRIDTSIIMANTSIDSTYDSTGVKYFGNGTAKATASFLDGLVIGQGQYINAQGQPSSYSVLESEKFNEFTYQITVSKEIEKYRNILLNLLHPTGTKSYGRLLMDSHIDYDYAATRSSLQGYPLNYYTNSTESSGQMFANFINKSNNIVKFSNLNGAVLSDFISANDLITITPQNGPNVSSVIVSVNDASNTITLESNTWLTFMNVANVSANANSNVINITSITESYDIINNGSYSDPQYPLKDIVYIGDTIKIANNLLLTVGSVDYINNRLITVENTTSAANSVLSVNRTFNTTQVRLFNNLDL